MVDLIGRDMVITDPHRHFVDKRSLVKVAAEHRPGRRLAAPPPFPGAPGQKVLAPQRQLLEGSKAIYVSENRRLSDNGDIREIAGDIADRLKCCCHRNGVGVDLFRPRPRFQQHMGVDTAEAERTDRRPQGLARLSGRPGFGRGLNAERAVDQWTVFRGSREIGGRRDGPMLKPQQRFYHTGGAGGRQQMPDHGFDRADRTLSRRPAGITPQSPHAGQFHGITNRGARAVALDKIDIMRRPAGLVIGRPHGPKLAFGFRR